MSVVDPSAVSQLVAALAVLIPRSAGAESRLLGVHASARMLANCLVTTRLRGSHFQL